MPIAIRDKDSAILKIVPDGHIVDGETVTTPSGFSWTVAGATSHAPITQAEVDKYAAIQADYESEVQARAEIAEAKRTVWIATHNALPNEAGEAEIKADLPAEPTKPKVYQDSKGDVVTTKPKTAKAGPK